MFSKFKHRPFSLVVEHSLRKRKVPCSIHGGGNLFFRREATCPRVLDPLCCKCDGRLTFLLFWPSHHDVPAVRYVRTEV